MLNKCLLKICSFISYKFIYRSRINYSVNRSHSIRGFGSYEFSGLEYSTT